MSTSFKHVEKCCERIFIPDCFRDNMDGEVFEVRLNLSRLTVLWSWLWYRIHFWRN